MVRVRSYLSGGGWRRRVGMIVLGLVVVLVAAGAVGSVLRDSSLVAPIAPASASTSSIASTPEPSPEGCTTGPAGRDVRVNIYGAGENACSTFNREASASSEQFWRTVPTGNEVQGSELVCSMARGGSEVIEVRDTGGHDLGNGICAHLTAKGWHEQEGPGAQLVRERQAREAKQRELAELHETEQRGEEAARREAEDRKREAELKREEQRNDRENKRNEAEYKKREAESNRQLEHDERQNREDTRKAEEETTKAVRESEAG